MSALVRGLEDQYSTESRPNKFCFILFATFVTSLLFSVALHAGHTETGTDYGRQGVDTYAKMRHGPDGKLFLDPYIISFLQETQGQILLDAGCGAGPWSIFAADNGAIVYGIDIQENMVEKARLAAKEANTEENTWFEVGDVGNLPYPDAFFDKAISLNVGCNLPSLDSHVRELRRVLKNGGSALVSAPSSFGTVFTDGQNSSEKISQRINQLLSSNSQDTFPQAIQELDEIYRATFAERQGRWVLISEEQELISGEVIWRKIPKMTVPNYYHSEEEYPRLFESEGFILKDILHPKFHNEIERMEYLTHQNHPLGASYVNASPFVIFIIEKR